MANWLLFCPPQIIIAAYTQVRTTQDKESKRGPYQIIVDATERAKRKYASFHGVAAATVRHSKEFSLKNSAAGLEKALRKGIPGKVQGG